MRMEAGGPRYASMAQRKWLSVNQLNEWLYNNQHVYSWQFFTRILIIYNIA
jgi:hypothetical protein